MMHINKFLFVLFLLPVPCAVGAYVPMPDTYERMSAIHNTVAARILPGINWSNNLKIEFAVKNPNITANEVVIGGGNGVAPWVLVASHTTHISLNGLTSIPLTNKNYIGMVSVMVDIPNKQFISSLESNNKPKALSGTPSLPNVALSIGSQNGGSSQFYGSIYYVKIWESGELIRDMVAAKRKSDNVCGMWDYANGVFYPPTAGTFTCVSFTEDPWKI